MKLRPEWLDPVFRFVYGVPLPATLTCVPMGYERVAHACADVVLKYYVGASDQLRIAVGYCPGCGQGWWAEDRSVVGQTTEKRQNDR